MSILVDSNRLPVLDILGLFKGPQGKRTEAVHFLKKRLFEGNPPYLQSKLAKALESDLGSKPDHNNGEKLD
jgi:hypothetical protein